MSDLIILTAADAAKVRGKSSPMAAIEPIPLKDGTFMLGAGVLADPAHAKHLAVLSTLSKATVAEKQSLFLNDDGK